MAWLRSPTPIFDLGSLVTVPPNYPHFSECGVRMPSANLYRTGAVLQSNKHGTKSSLP